jgi:hypothetical protein
MMTQFSACGYALRWIFQEFDSRMLDVQEYWVMAFFYEHFKEIGFSISVVI